MTDTTMTPGAAPVLEGEDAELERQFGYKPQLQRTLGFFSNFGIAFCYLSPVVGIYSLFAFGVGLGGPAYIWTIPVVVVGQLLVASCSPSSPARTRWRAPSTSGRSTFSA